MPSTRLVLQTEAGVTLTEVTLSNGGGHTLAIAYEVSSRRTSEVRPSHTRETAERHYAEEVARCQGTRP